MSPPPTSARLYIAPIQLHLTNRALKNAQTCQLLPNGHYEPIFSFHGYKPFQEYRLFSFSSIGSKEIRSWFICTNTVHTPINVTNCYLSNPSEAGIEGSVTGNRGDSLFSRERSKRRETNLYLRNLREADPGVWGLAPRNQTTLLLPIAHIFQKIAGF